jgi:non-canonical (house-cleaning) NTP pyrophosphatase
MMKSFLNLPTEISQNYTVKIGIIGSESMVKLTPIREIFQQIMPDNQWDFLGVPAKSGKPEQPEEGETLEGAVNRANDAMKMKPDADLVIAIENGIFKKADNSAEGFSYYDKAVIYCLTKGGASHTYYSDAVKLPTDCVEIARKRGFNKCTVGMVMLEKGLIRNHKDPHADIAPFKSRAEYIKETVSRLCIDLFKHAEPNRSVHHYISAQGVGGSLIALVKTAGGSPLHKREAQNKAVMKKDFSSPVLRNV